MMRSLLSVFAIILVLQLVHANPKNDSLLPEKPSKQFKIGDRIYEMHDREKLSWLDAKIACKYYHETRLLSLETLEEELAVKTEILINYPGVTVWTSGTNIGQPDGKFYWSESGVSIAHYTNWAAGEPAGGETCVQLWGNANHQWDDTNCDGLAYFICETNRCR